MAMAMWSTAFPAENQSAVATATVVTGLRTDYRVTPLGFDRLPPKLLWRIDADRRTGAAQTAYRIQAAPDRDTLVSGTRLLWDSGRVVSAESTQIAYAGPKLEGRQRIWWRVKIWDENAQESPWPEPTWFETGLLAPKDWQAAEWIGCNRDFRAPELAPDGVMGDWIVGPAGKECMGLFQDVVLPGKPLVSAVAWWGLSRSLGAASVVANFDSSTASEQSAMVRAGHGSNGGFLDLAFLRLPHHARCRRFAQAGRECLGGSAGRGLVS